MPYSVKHSLTIGEIIAKLTKPDAHIEDACELRTGPALEGPHGAIHVRYLYRENSARRYVAIIPGLSDDTWLAPSVVRTICTQLGFRPDKFGVLGERIAQRVAELLRSK